MEIITFFKTNLLIWSSELCQTRLIVMVTRWYWAECADLVIWTCITSASKKLFPAIEVPFLARVLTFRSRGLNCPVQAKLNCVINSWLNFWGSTSDDRMAFSNLWYNVNSPCPPPLCRLLPLFRCFPIDTVLGTSPGGLHVHFCRRITLSGSDQRCGGVLYFIHYHSVTMGQHMLPLTATSSTFMNR